MADPARVGTVYLVGAGPGDVGLLTLRAVECLRSADFILHDYLISPRALDFAPAHAETMCVDQLPGTHPQRWPHIHDRLISEARRGRTVVHLKGGDPSVFGRGGEEAEALRAADVPYEIVPGVTAAFAAGACAEIPLTHRSHASAIALVTGHEHPGKVGSRLDWDALAKFPGTLAVYMGVARLGGLCRELIARGKPAETPAVLVQSASTGAQRTVDGTLADLEEKVRHAGLTAPSILLIGSVVERKPARSWFEARPLHGMRVLVTRPRAQGLPFVRRLELLGAVADLLPALEVRPPADWSKVDSAIAGLSRGEFDWLVFTSANGVNSFFERLDALRLDARALGVVRLAAIGPATADALAERRLWADIVPTKQLNSEGLVNELVGRCRGQRVLIAAASQGREYLRDRLTEVATLTVAPVYEQVASVDASADVFDRLRRGEIHVVTLTSPNVAKAFLAACDATILGRFRRGPTRLIANSERLAAVLHSEGLPFNVASGPMADDIIASLMELRPNSDR